MSRLNKSINSHSLGNLVLPRQKSISLTLDKSKSFQKQSKLIKKPNNSSNSVLKPISQKPTHSLSNQTLQKPLKGPNPRKKILSKLSPPLITQSQNSITLPNTVLSPQNLKIRSKPPIRPRDALIIYSQELTPYEQSEILNYREIYYLGYKPNKISSKIDLSNFGFDDNNSNLILQKSDHIAYRYQVLAVLGRGTFGQVFECFDHKREQKVAVKVIRNKKRFYTQAGIEVSILTSLQENDVDDKKPVIKLKNYFLFRMHVCLTFELWNVSLYELVKINKFKGLSFNLIRCFASQILEGLEYLASLNIIHCDLKPENILLKSGKKSKIGIIDFGSSTFYNEKIHVYIQSRFYRAPEIVLGIPYTPAIDMWSLGCILFELYTGRPLFPAVNEHDLLLLITELLGYPKKSLLEKSPKYEKFFIEGRLKDDFLQNGTKIIPASLKLPELLNCPNDDFLDFLSKCLELDPESRLTPSSGLSHKWITFSNPKKRLI